mmetsp:Transcript_110678/g.219990  ORF Transcript_110678/g.219990 Transcript_110678/m.219990 type:complete len:212 (-) Transcript_110678:105-740(-)
MAEEAAKLFVNDVEMNIESETGTMPRRWSSKKVVLVMVMGAMLLGIALANFFTKGSGNYSVSKDGGFVSLSMDIDYTPTPEMMEALKPTMMAHAAARSALPQEVQDKLKAMQPTSTEEKEQNDHQMMSMFTQADSDGDRILNVDEWLAFRKLFTALQTAHAGGCVAVTEQEDRDAWDAINKFDASYEGLKLDDLRKAVKTFRAIAAQMHGH